jgi:hypothetical protein
MDIKILQLNCRILMPNITEIKKYLSEQDISVDMFQETWLKDEIDLKIKNFRVLKLPSTHNDFRGDIISSLLTEATDMFICQLNKNPESDPTTTMTETPSSIW